MRNKYLPTQSASADSGTVSVIELKALVREGLFPGFQPPLASDPPFLPSLYQPQAKPTSNLDSVYIVFLPFWP